MTGMATDKQRQDMAALYKRKGKRHPKNRLYGYSKEDFTDDGGISYASARELKEISEKLKQGGYERLG